MKYNNKYFMYRTVDEYRKDLEEINFYIDELYSLGLEETRQSKDLTKQRKRILKMITILNCYYKE